MNTAMFVKLSSGIEFATGISLIVAPVFLARLIFGAQFPGNVAVMGRMVGVALLCLGLTCWFRYRQTWALRVLLLYNLIAGLSLVYVGVAIRAAGYLLWPACVLHLALAVLLGIGLARGIRRDQRAETQ